MHIMILCSLFKLGSKQVTTNFKQTENEEKLLVTCVIPIDSLLLQSNTLL